MKKSKLTETTVEGIFNEDTACCFIVEKRHRKAFIKNLAYKLIKNGCRQFEFCGRYAEKWQYIFMNADIELKGELNENNVSVIIVWDNKADFWEAVACIGKERVHFFFDTDNLLK